MPAAWSPARLIGVIEAEQTEEDGKTERNDRLIAVAADSRNHRDIATLDQINENLVEEIEHFFVSYNRSRAKQFAPRDASARARAPEAGRRGPGAGQAQSAAMGGASRDHRRGRARR